MDEKLMKLSSFTLFMIIFFFCRTTGGQSAQGSQRTLKFKSKPLPQMES